MFPLDQGQTISTTAPSADGCIECFSKAAAQAIIAKMRKARPDELLLSLLFTPTSVEHPCATISKDDPLEQLSLASTADSGVSDHEDFDDPSVSVSANVHVNTIGSEAKSKTQNVASSYISFRDLTQRDKAETEIRIATMSHMAILPSPEQGRYSEFQ